MWDQFELGFWHPFGPYTGLSTDEVLEWKGGEVERHGWTFWSFVYSSSADLWLDLLAKAQSPVFALALIAPAPGIQIATRALSQRRTIAILAMTHGNACLIRAS
jgi:hypothetical protein